MHCRKHRRSIRLSGYDYAQEGAYFITICTYNKEPLFGTIVDSIMRLNKVGEIIDTQWLALKQRFPTVELYKYVIMPNHFHAIIEIVHSDVIDTDTVVANDNVNTTIVGAGLCPALLMPCVAAPLTPCAALISMPSAGNLRAGQSPAPTSSPPTPSSPPLPITVGNVIGAFKSITTKMCNRMNNSPGRRVWQRNYYEHIIRNDVRYQRIVDYIVTNPARWEQDCYR